MSVDEKRRQKKLAKKAAERKARHTQLKKSSQTHVDSILTSVKAPIAKCFVPTSLLEDGMGTVILTRSLPSGQIAMASFLVDMQCLGVKNATYAISSPAAFAEYLDNAEQVHTLEMIHPSCLRKLVEGAVQYARDLGFAPHSDYAIASKMFGDIDAAACPVRYTYGLRGQPFYSQGPYETPAQVRKIMQTLERKLGKNGFRYMIEADPDGIGGLHLVSEQPPANPVLRLEMVSYKITDEPLEGTAFALLPQSVRDEIQEICHHTMHSKPQAATATLQALIARYPDVPMLYNRLYQAYVLSGDLTKARNIVAETVQLFPDYLFGRLALAEHCLLDRQTQLIPEIFDDKYDLKALYPEREIFHTSEVISFGAVMAKYFHALGQQKQAKVYYEMICKVDSNHALAKQIKQLLFPQRFGDKLRKLIPWLNR